MTSVDSRIVTMKFDNSLFERAASATMSTLEKLKTAISGLPNSTKGLSALSDTTKRFSLGGMLDQVHHVNAAFLGMATVGITALANITNRAIDAGINIAKSLTINPIIQGFGDYETKINAVQTILANTQAQGTKLSDVTKALAQLNTYANKTVYNFSEMARNIGTFTAAGVDLKTSVSSIKGIANLGALSGSNAQQVSTAMYQLSQAVAAGTVHLMDWRSVVNAGMGGAVFQRALVQTATTMGTLNKNVVKSVGPMHQLQINGLAFGNSLSPKPGQPSWLTSDVLTKTLAQFTGDLSNAQLKAQGFNKAQITAIQKQALMAKNAATQVKTFSQLMQALKEEVATAWSNIFATIFGNINQAKRLFSPLHTTLENMLTGPIYAFNKVLEKWANLGGRTKLIKTIVNLFKDLGRVLTPIKNAFRDIFPPVTGRDLFKITKALDEFTKHLSLSKAVMKDIRATFDGVFSILAIGIDVVKNIIKYFATFIGLILQGIFPAAKGILDFTGNIGEMLTKIKEFLVDGGAIDNFFNKIISGRARLLGPIFVGIGKVIGAVFKLISQGLTWLLNGLDKVTPYIGRAFDAVAQGLTWVSHNVDKLAPYADRVINFVEKVYNIVKNWASLRVGDAMKWISDHQSDFRSWADSASAFVHSGFDKVIGWLSQLKPYVADVKELAKALKDLVLNGLSGLGSTLGPMLAGLGGSIKHGLGGLAGAAGGLLGKIDLGSMFNMGGASDAAVSGLNKVGGALQKTGSVADKVKTVWEAIVKAFEAVGRFLSPVAHAVGGLFIEILAKIKDFLKGLNIQDLLALINTAFFIMFWRMAMKFVGTLDGLGKSVKETLEVATKGLKTMQRGVQAAILLNIAIAVGILAAALFVLSKINPRALGFAIGAVISMFAALAATIKILDKTLSSEDALSGAKMLAITTSMIALGTALLVLSLALKVISTIDTKGILKGLGTMVVVLGVLVKVADSLGPKGAASMILASLAIGVLGASLVVLAGALKLYSMIDFKTIIDGGLKAALTVAALGFAMQFFPKSGALAGAAALAVVSVSLLILAAALSKMGKMSWGQILKSITELGLVLLEIGIFLASMESGIAGAAALVVFAFGLNMLLVPLVAMSKMSWSQIWKGIEVLGVVLGALAIGALAVTPAIPSLFLLAVALEMLGVASLAVGAGLMLAATGLALLAASGTAGFAVLTAGLSGFLEMLPLFIQQFGVSIHAMAKVIKTEGPPIVAALGAVVREMLRQVRKNLPEFGRLMTTLIHTGLRVIRSTFPDFIRTAFDLLDAFFHAVQRRIPKIVPLGIRMIVTFINAINQRMGKVVDAGVRLVIKFVNSVASSINRHSGEMGAAGANLGWAIITGMLKALGNGLKWVAAKAVSVATAAINAAKHKLGINSPSKEFVKIGASVNEGFALGLEKHAHLTHNAASGVAEGALETIRVSMSKAGDVMNGHLDMRPRITPVLDLTHMAREATKIGGMLGTSPIKAHLSYSRANAISIDQQRAHNDAANDVMPEPVVQEIKFEQHNTSPKALSSVEIYRNTRNQLSQAKEALSK